MRRPARAFGANRRGRHPHAYNYAKRYGGGNPLGYVYRRKGGALLVDVDGEPVRFPVRLHYCLPPHYEDGKLVIKPGPVAINPRKARSL